jgi:hypothetical protein
MTSLKGNREAQRNYVAKQLQEGRTGEYKLQITKDRTKYKRLRKHEIEKLIEENND